MPLVTDDLDVKYGVVDQNDVADKKKRKKWKGRTLEIDFPFHSNELIQWVDVVLISLEIEEFHLFILEKISIKKVVDIFVIFAHKKSFLK